MTRRLVPLDEQRARQRELDLIRLSRPLTTSEQAEADRLAAREQMRAWRQLQRDRELAITARLKPADQCAPAAQAQGA